MNTNYMRYSLILFFFTILIAPAFAQTQDSVKLIKNQLPITDGLALIKTLQPISFDYDRTTVKSLPATKQFSVNALGTSTLPQMLLSDNVFYYSNGKNGFGQVKVLTINFEKLVPFMIKAILEQQKEIEELKKSLSLSHK